MTKYAATTKNDTTDFSANVTRNGRGIHRAIMAANDTYFGVVLSKIHKEKQQDMLVK